MFVNVAKNTNNEFKNILGMLAYYLNGLKELSSIETTPLRITTYEDVIEDDFLLFLILNGGSAGGFSNLGKHAKMDDGLLDLVAIKGVTISNLPELLFKIIQGNHINDDNVIHLKTSYLKIELMNKNIGDFKVNLDGEEGPELPIEVFVDPEGIDVFTK